MLSVVIDTARDGDRSDVRELPASLGRARGASSVTTVTSAREGRAHPLATRRWIDSSAIGGVVPRCSTRTLAVDFAGAVSRKGIWAGRFRWTRDEDAVDRREALFQLSPEAGHEPCVSEAWLGTSWPRSMASSRPSASAAGALLRASPRARGPRRPAGR